MFEAAEMVNARPTGVNPNSPEGEVYLCPNDLQTMSPKGHSRSDAQTDTDLISYNQLLQRFGGHPKSNDIVQKTD